jgi:hypothetical protein
MIDEAPSIAVEQPTGTTPEQEQKRKVIFLNKNDARGGVVGRPGREWNCECARGGEVGHRSYSCKRFRWAPELSVICLQ